MARYRKISTFTQNDEKFRSLSDDGQLVWFLLLSHPHMTALGAMRGTIPGLAAEKNWPERRYRKAFAEPFRKGMVKYDERAALIWLPNFLKHNPPENPNVVKSWGTSLDLLPECSLKNELVYSVKEYCEGLPKAFAEGLPEPFRKSMPIQEQEQLQEQINTSPLTPLLEEKPHGRGREKASKSFPPPDTIEPSPNLIAWHESHFPQYDLRFSIEACLDHYRKKGMEAVDYEACVRTWERNGETMGGVRIIRSLNGTQTTNLIPDELGTDVHPGEF